MTERQEIIERLNGLELEGGSHEMLSAICKAVYEPAGGLTIVACEALRQTLVRLLGGDVAQGGCVTNELRHEVANYPFRDNRDFALFEDIADRIDAELAKRYVEMPAKVDGPPKDIDGEIWHYGDKAKSVIFPKTAPRTVCGFGVINGRHVLFYLSENCSGHKSELHQGWDYADGVRHYHVPTTEDVLREFADEVQRCCDTADTIAEYAAKLRLAEESE